MLRNSEKQDSPDNSITKSVVLQPAQTVAFTFHCKAPNLLHERKYDAQFEIAYTEIEQEKKLSFLEGRL